ncbi:dihydrofolate reductase family protein [Arthrobacter sunyaminii]|uniref:dihydrofolate reductase family protein n=1 Tax=Arthrobacter sunyaminii TaxID=2816859 RepID=UPI001A945D48|nr:dihydrofolate reductase family protein [Arthrobacter sunyaminii]MBO0895615.1 dihydrofolate reductase family protein [Arthrobacter sunyaminii]
MAGTIYYVAASQDGFIAQAPGPGEWLRTFAGAPEHAGAREAEAHVSEFLAAAGAVAMGAETYRSFVTDPGSWPFGSIPVWVFTHHEFPGISGADITFVRGDVAEFHPDILHDAGQRDVVLTGGGNLAGQFLDSGLVDEMVVTVLPISPGSGRELAHVVDGIDPAGVRERSLGGAVLQRRYDLRR